MSHRDFISLTGRNVKVWCLMAFQAGAINAGGFIACKRFVTHTTGFATHFGFDLATLQWKDALGMLSVPTFFLLGAMITSYFVDLPLVEERSPNYKIPSLLIVVCLSVATILGELGVFGLFGQAMVIDKDYLFMAVLCLASGLQNAMITNANGVVVRTTHLTGITTDLGVGLVRLFFAKHRDPAKFARDKLASLTRAALIGSFVLGSAISSFLLIEAEYFGFVLPLLTSLLMLRYFSVRSL